MATTEKRKDKAKKRVVNVEAVGQAHIQCYFQQHHYFDDQHYRSGYLLGFCW